MNIDLSQLVTADTKQAAALDQARANARARLLDLVQAFADAVTGNVPLAEMLSWTLKEAAAQAVLAQTATPDQTALLAGEAAVTGETEAALAARIVANAASWRQLIATLTGLRRKVDAEIAGADSPKDVAQAMRNGTLAVEALAASLKP